MLPGAHRVENGKGRVYWYSSRDRDRLLLWSGTAEEETSPETAKAIAEAWLDATRSELAAGTVGRLIQDYLASKAFKRLAPATQALYEDFGQRAIARPAICRLALGEFAGRRGRAAIRAWREEVAKTSPRNADQIRTVLGAVAKWGRREDILDLHCEPCKDLEVYYHAPPQSAWTNAEVELAVAKLPINLSCAVEFAVLTGLRRGDLVAITKQALDPERGVIRWHTSKGARYKRQSIIDLTPELRACLERIPAHDAPTILANSRGRPWTPGGLHSSLVAELEPLGIDKTLHALRRSSATRLEAQGMQPADIARRLGWSLKEVQDMLATYVDPEAKVGHVNPPVNPTSEDCKKTDG